MPNLPLDIRDDLTSIGLIPAPVQLLGGHAELDDEVAREVLRLDLPAFFPPKPQESVLVVAHDDPGVRAADEKSAVLLPSFAGFTFHPFLRAQKWAWLIRRCLACLISYGMKHII